MARLSDKLIGHEATLKPLLQAAVEGRLAATLLFAGPAGVGKKLAARVLAQRLVCEKPEGLSACGTCGPCLRLEKGQSESFMFVEPDGAQIKIEQARDVLQFLSLRNLGRARIILIDPAHAMGPQAANALLKALEEPPPGTYFILVTSQAAALLPTIRSRSQLVRFKPLSTAELSRVLTAQGITSPDPWTVSNAHGSVEMASRLSESRESYVELEDLVARYLATAPARFPNEEISALRERMKDRSSQNFVATLLQSLMSDTLRAQAGVNVERDSQWVDLVQGLAKFKPEAIRILSERSIEFEHDLARNVDRGLLLENFALIVKQGSQGGLG